MAKGGKTQPSNAPYRDDEEQDAVSLHTTHGDFTTEDDVPDVLGPPPAYTDDGEEQGNAESAVPLANVHHFNAYTNRNGVDIVMDPRLDSDATHLEETIARWALTPPAQMIHLRGTHTETKRDGKKEERSTVVDFDIKLRLTEYFFNVRGRSTWSVMETVENHEKTYRGGWRKTTPARLVDVETGMEPPGLREWAHRFCANHSALKTFRLTRQVTGLNTEYLKERLASLIRNTNYKGNLDISFPVENRAVDIYSTHWQNRWRLNGWVKFAFIISFLWIFAWPWLFFRTRRYHVVKVYWPFSIPSFGENNDDIAAGSSSRMLPNGRLDTSANRYATLSEAQWFERWAATIEREALRRRQGTLTEEDRSTLVQTERLRDVDTGNSGFNSALRFVDAAYTEVNRQIGWGGDT